MMNLRTEASTTAMAASLGAFDLDAAYREQQAKAERLAYLSVAVMRGDPRFAKPEYADPDFDGVAFDAWWAAQGNRVPSLAEVFDG